MSAKEQYNRMITEIEKEAGRKDLSANDLATQIARDSGLGPRDLTAVMRYLTGDTLLEYIKSRKLMAAYRYLIEDPKPKILSAVEISGLDNQSSFTKRFSREFGIPPKEAMQQKDRSRLVGPMDWDVLSAGTSAQRVLPETGPEPEGETIFGVPRMAYFRAMKAAELEALYSLQPLFSRIAYEYAERAIEDFDLQDDIKESEVELEESFRFLESIQDWFLPEWERKRQQADPENPEPTEEEKEREIREVADDLGFQYLFLRCGLSVGSAQMLMMDRIMPDGETLWHMDPKMIRAFYEAVENGNYDFNILFFMRAYEYYQSHADENYQQSDYEEYLDWLDKGYCAEEAFECLTPGFDEIANDSQYLRAQALELREELRELRYAPRSTEEPEDMGEAEERWRKLSLGLDLDETDEEDEEEYEEDEDEEYYESDKDDEDDEDYGDDEGDEDDEDDWDDEGDEDDGYDEYEEYDEENREYEMEDMMDPGPLDF